MRRLLKKDIIASCAVAAAVVLYVLWVADATVPWLSGTRGTGVAVLTLGFVASATAVVPGFDQLLHGSRLYLATTSALGVAALVAGVVMLWTASATALAVLMAALVTLWLISTTHHVVLARTQLRTLPGEPVATVDARSPVDVR